MLFEKDGVIKTHNNPNTVNVLLRYGWKPYTPPKAKSAEPEKESAGDSEQEETTKEFICPECGFVAASKSGLSAHVRAKHPKE